MLLFTFLRHFLSSSWGFSRYKLVKYPISLCLMQICVLVEVLFQLRYLGLSSDGPWRGPSSAAHLLGGRRRGLRLYFGLDPEVEAIVGRPRRTVPVVAAGARWARRTGHDRCTGWRRFMERGRHRQGGVGHGNDVVPTGRYHLGSIRHVSWEEPDTLRRFMTFVQKAVHWYVFCFLYSQSQTELLQSETQDTKLNKTTRHQAWCR